MSPEASTNHSLIAKDLQLDRKTRNFLEKLAPANGELVRVRGKKTRLDEPVYITARKSPAPDNSEIYLLIDLAAKRRGELTFMGMRNWTISVEPNYLRGGQKTVADGGFNRHMFVESTYEFQNEYSRKTQDGLFVVDQTFQQLLETEKDSYIKLLEDKGLLPPKKKLKSPIYRRDGFGSFMTAVSFFLLQDMGVTELSQTQVAYAARRVWSRFGRRSSLQTTPPDPWGYSNERHFSKEIKLEKVIKHSYTSDVLGRFV